MVGTLSRQRERVKTLRLALIFRLGVKVAGVMALMQLLIERAVGAVDDASALDGRAVADILRPAQHVFIAPGVEELRRVIDIAQHYVAIPRPDSHIGDGVLLAGHIATAGELFVQHVELAFSFHRKAVDRVLDLHWRIVIEVAEAAAEERRRALQPEQPVEGFGATGRIFRQEETKFFRQIEKNVAGLKYPGRRRGGMVAEGRDLRVRVDLDKAAGKLIPFANAYQSGVVLRAADAQRQQLLQHDRHLLAVGRAE